jgi:hypothetical protein
MPAMVRRRRCPDVGATLQRYERPGAGGAGARVQRTAGACAARAQHGQLARRRSVERQEWRAHGPVVSPSARNRERRFRERILKRPRCCIEAWWRCQAQEVLGVVLGLDPRQAGRGWRRGSP